MISSPLSNELQELATNYVLDDLETAEIAKVEQLMLENPILFEEIRQLQAVVGTLVAAIPPLQPPAHLWGKVLETVTFSSPSRQIDVSEIFVNLGLWLDEIFEPLWQPPEALNLAFSARRTANLQEPTIRRGKIVPLGTEPDSKAIILLIGLNPQSEDQVSVNIQLHPQANQPYLPANLQLKLLSDSDEVLKSIQSRSEDNYIKLPRFTVTLGFQFNLQINLDQFSFREKFVV